VDGDYACIQQQYFTNENGAYFDKTRGYNTMSRKSDELVNKTFDKDE
jgi:hypothetical protein